MAIVTSDLDLFHTIPENAYIVSKENVIVQPSVYNSNTNQIVFTFSSGGTSFLTNEFVLRATFEITLEDGSALTGNDTVAPLPGILWTWFQDVNIRINDVTVHTSNGLSPLVNYLKAELGYPQEFKTGPLANLIGWIQDTPKKYDEMAEANNGFWQRARNHSVSKKQSYCFEIPLDFTMSKKIWLPNTDFVITFTHAPDNFRLSSAAAAPATATTTTASTSAEKKYKLHVRNPELLLTRLWLKDNYVKAVYDTFHERGYITYPFKRFQVTGPYPVQSSTTNLNIVLGTSVPEPLMVIAFFVKTAALSGDYKLNPFDWAPSVQVKSCFARFGGKLSPSSGPIEMRFGGEYLMQPDLSQVYYNAYKYLSDLSANGFNIDFTRFLHNCNLYVFDFSLCATSAEYTSAVTSARETVSLNFSIESPGPTVNHSLIAISLHQNEIKYETSRVVSLNYAPGVL